VLDINLIREEPDLVREALRKRQLDPEPVDQVLELDDQRRNLIQQVEGLKAERNLVSKEIGKMKDQSERQAKIDQMRGVGERIDALDNNLREVENRLEALMSEMPNIPDPDVPLGIDESQNVIIKAVGKLPEYDSADRLDAGFTYPAGLYGKIHPFYGQERSLVWGWTAP
jgi:seryl-tRNA synthetase